MDAPSKPEAAKVTRAASRMAVRVSGLPGRRPVRAELLLLLARHLRIQLRRLIQVGVGEERELVVPEVLRVMPRAHADAHGLQS